jgi:hypothetical protein
MEHVPKLRYVRFVSDPISLGIVPVRALNTIAGFCESKQGVREAFLREYDNGYASYKRVSEQQTLKIELVFIMPLYVLKSRLVKLVNIPISVGVDPGRLLASAHGRNKQNAVDELQNCGELPTRRKFPSSSNTV